MASLVDIVHVPSSGASSAGSEARQCMVALHNYDPLHSGAFGRPPQDQLSLKKGDIVTAYGDMDVNGFYRIDVLFSSLMKSLFLFIKLIQSVEAIFRGISWQLQHSSVLLLHFLISNGLIQLPQQFYTSALDCIPTTITTITSTTTTSTSILQANLPRSF